MVWSDQDIHLTPFGPIRSTSLGPSMLFTPANAQKLKNTTMNQPTATVTAKE